MEISDIFAKAKNERRSFLSYPEAKEVLAMGGIPTAPIRIAHSRDEAVEAARLLGFPVVMKILSPDPLHKSDVGGVAVDLRSEAEVANGWDRMMERLRKRQPPLRVEGILLEKMLSGIEMIVGTTYDPQFGPVLMVGTGGTWTELFRDMSFRLVPIDPGDAEEMIEELRSYRLLRGYRQEAVDLEGLKKLLLKVSDLISRYREITSIDLNPVFCSSEGCMVADVRMEIAAPVH